MRALALEHLRADPVGIFGDLLEERAIAVDVVQLEQGEPLPDWRDYDLLVVTPAELATLLDVETATVLSSGSKRTANV